MSTSGTSGVQLPGATTNSSVKVTGDLTDPYEQKEMFLKLLVAQLKNQDPTSPMDQKDMLGQMAQFSTVEQLTNLAKTMGTMQVNATFASSVNLIGKTVSYIGADGNTVAGATVTGVSAAGGTINLVLSDGNKVAPADVVTVS
jgi:flagellar basal-body rod modification protein FlgD